MGLQFEFPQIEAWKDALAQHVPLLRFLNGGQMLERRVAPVAEMVVPAKVPRERDHGDEFHVLSSWSGVSIQRSTFT